jgi:hypothetical protein
MDDNDPNTVDYHLALGMSPGSKLQVILHVRGAAVALIEGADRQQLRLVLGKDRSSISSFSLDQEQAAFCRATELEGPAIQLHPGVVVQVRDAATREAVLTLLQRFALGEDVVAGRSERPFHEF